jgi:hypothetical protein
VSSFRYLLDKIVFVNRTNCQVVSRNLYVWEMSNVISWSGVRFARKLVIYRRHDCYQRRWILLGVMCAVGAVMAIMWGVLVVLRTREAELKKRMEWMQARE